MKSADMWVIKELTGLKFTPYNDLLPRVSDTMSQIRGLEILFVERIGTEMKKRQAVGMGLLARTYQLGVSCLMNQLMQNYAGWSCSCRSLLETFFVVEWICRDPQRLEAYFEGTAPGIGRIKADCCGRYPEFIDVYQDVSNVTHVRSRALHLPRKRDADVSNEFPFTATSLSVSGGQLVTMLERLEKILLLIREKLHNLLIEQFEITTQGETLWKKGETSFKYGCLGWEPRDRV